MFPDRPSYFEAQRTSQLSHSEQLRLGRISYLNTEPFFASDGLRDNSITGSPSQLTELMLKGSVDIAPIPSVVYFDNPEQFRILGSFGIVSRKKAVSVILRSSKPPQHLSSSDHIGITADTRTSRRLLQVLLLFYFGTSALPHFDNLRNKQPNQLLIGDKAMAAISPTDEYPYVTDLGLIWNKLTGSSFVFALWLSQTNIIPSVESKLINYFERNLSDNLSSAERISARRPDLSMTTTEISEYLSGFRFKLNDTDMDALEKFKLLDARVRQRISSA